MPNNACGFWISSNRGSAYYNIPGAIHLLGELNVTALQQTVNEIVRRHEVLRTSFAMMDGTPVQVITNNSTCPSRSSTSPASHHRPGNPSSKTGSRRKRKLPLTCPAVPWIRVSLLRLAETDQDSALHPASHRLGWLVHGRPSSTKSQFSTLPS